MKIKNVTIFKTKQNILFTNKRVTLKSLTRYLLILIFICLITFTLFQMEGPIYNGKLALSAISKIVTIVLLLLIAEASIRMNQYHLVARFFNSIMAIIAAGYASFITVFLRDKVWTNINELHHIYYYISGIIGLTSMWSIGIAILERRRSPFVARLLISKSIYNILSQGAVFLTYQLLNSYTTIFGNKNPNIFNLESKIQFMNMLLIAAMFLSAITLYLFTIIKYRKTIKANYLLKNVLVSISMIIILSLTIWFIFSSFDPPGNISDYLILIIPLITVGVSILFTFKRKGSLASPKISSIVYSISLLLIWINKFAMEYIYSDIINSNWKIIITIISISLITILIFIKNSTLSKLQSLAQLLLSVLVGAFIILGWFISEWYDVKKTINFILKLIGLTYNEVSNSIVLISLVLLVFLSLLSWYLTQSKINRNLSKKLKLAKKNSNVSKVIYKHEKGVSND